MNKKVMALAVAGALAAPAAALAQVQIGGSLTVFYYNHEPDNSNVGQSGDILESSEPEVYIRGEEKLGGGLSVWFQCASSMDAMITGSATAQGICARNSGVGFRGGFGNAFVGNWDTPQKLIFNKARGWFGSTNAFTGGVGVILMGGGPSAVANPVTSQTGVLSNSTAATITTITSNSPAGFARRQSSSLNYHSPDWGGFSILAAYSADNESTGRPESSPLSPRMYSLGAQFATGPFYVGLGYENHADYNPANRSAGYTGGDDTNMTVVLGLRMGGFDVRAMYSKSEYETGLSQNLDVDGWGVWADWNISGPHTLRAQYVMSNDTKGNSTAAVGSYRGPAANSCGLGGTVGSCASNTGADLFGIFYSFAFSKRTEMSFGYSQLGNDSGATFSKGKTASTTGGTQKTTGILLKHSF